MYARQTTPPSIPVHLYPEYLDQPSFEMPPGYLTPEASPEACGLASAASRSPIRQHGPLLLPKIRSQDQTAEPVGSGPVRHRRTASSASGTNRQSYSPYTRTSLDRRSMSPPESHCSFGSGTSTSLLSAYDAGLASSLGSPVRLSNSRCSSVAARHARSPSVSSTRTHSRSVSSTTVDEPVASRLAYKASRHMPRYVTSQPSVNLTTSMPSSHFQGYSYDEQIPAIHQPVQQPLVHGLAAEEFGQPLATTTLMDYLTAPNPSPALVQRITTGTRNMSGTHYWWDIRNLRSWTDFSIDTVTSIPGFMPLLNIPVDTQSLPAPSRPNLRPDSESDLHDICRDFYGVKMNAALQVAQGNSHMVMRSHKGTPSSQTPVDFVSNYMTDYEKTIYGDARGRVVGVVKAYDQWNTGMRREPPNKQVYYLAGLAHLHRVMREHGCRYGFIMNEIELLCVRSGGGPEDAVAAGGANGRAATTNTVVSADAGAGVPLFGFLELSEPIEISRHSSRHQQQRAPQMTAGLALWFLHMLAKENPLPGIQGSWRMEVGGPAALTRQHCLDKDSWIPKPNLSEKREAKRLRGWVFPEEPLNKKECGRGKRNRV
ncbi:uncharacterized protein IWZ02DRAFT_404062 [Phyllosticta citriasiana]|uniref:Sialidase n=1 Tax=Phyllosticta citriasiana TaxID=595635 RepID=A0ABR1KL36_9PEZI